MAFVPFGCSRNCLMALVVGRMTKVTFRRVASCFTSFITGSAPVPVPITSRLHFHGIFSSTDSGGVPILITIVLRWLLLTLANRTAVNHHVALVGDAINAYGTE